MVFTAELQLMAPTLLYFCFLACTGCSGTANDAMADNMPAMSRTQHGHLI